MRRSLEFLSNWAVPKLIQFNLIAPEEFKSCTKGASSKLFRKQLGRYIALLQPVSYVLKPTRLELNQNIAKHAKIWRNYIAKILTEEIDATQKSQLQQLYIILESGAVMNPRDLCSHLQSFISIMYKGTRVV